MKSPKEVFNDLQPGDTISQLGARTELVVLRVTEDGRKFLGVLNYGHGSYPIKTLPHYLTWDDTAERPVSVDGYGHMKNWKNISVAKGTNPATAAEYGSLPVVDDFISKKIADKFDIKPDDVQKAKLDKVCNILSCSGASESVNMIAILRALGVQISEEQAFLTLVALQINEETDRFDNSLVGLLSGSAPVLTILKATSAGTTATH